MTEMIIIGDSYIRRLECFMDQNLLFNGHCIYWTLHGLGGARINTIVPKIADMVPTGFGGIIFLAIGGNDITVDVQPEEVAVRMAALVHAVRGRSPHAIIVIGSIIPRESPRNMTKTAYAEKAKCTNKLLKALRVEHGCHFWNHAKRFGTRGCFLYDGVHLNNEGQFRFYKSIRTLHRYYNILYV